MTEQKATNIVWHNSSTTAEDRKKVVGHGAAVMWFTGLPSSGKSTLALAVEQLLIARSCHTYVLDGDNVRHGLNKNLGFSPEDRTENIRRIGEVAHLFADAGLLVLTAFISPYAKDRRGARDLNKEGAFIEIHCKCPLEVCEERDPKQLYKKARAGEIKGFTGVDAPYEIPEKAELTVATTEASVEECAAQVVAYLEDNGIISAC